MPYAGETESFGFAQLGHLTGFGTTDFLDWSCTAPKRPIYALKGGLHFTDAVTLGQGITVLGLAALKVDCPPPVDKRTRTPFWL